jgi:murein DD-endopeptidase MepM/ murein hydrolase activator NlpD
MPQRSRTTSRYASRGLLLLLLGGLFAAAIAVPTSGADARGGSADARKVPRLVFPLVAKTTLWDNYGDPRGNGRHAGIDMENPWRAPVVAVEPGRVEYASSNLGGCMLYLYGQSGTMYLYIHLNNDLGPRNDNKAGCVHGSAFAVPNGARVLTGQQIAYNGDSGDANGNPHLHFEVHPGGGADVSPFPHLKKAAKLLFSGREGAAFSLGLRGRVVAAGEESMKLAATHVRAYPGGRWLEIDERPLDLAYQPDPATVATRQLAPKPSARVAVFTAKAQVTKDALVGAPGTLKVARVTPLAP